MKEIEEIWKLNVKYKMVFVLEIKDIIGISIEIWIRFVD